MKFVLHLDQSVFSNVITEDTPTKHYIVPTELVLPNEKLVGVSTVQDGKLLQLDCTIIEPAKSVIRESVKIISPSLRLTLNSSLVYFKQFSRTVGQLYKDEYGYGNVDAMEINPLLDSGLRKRNVSYLNVKEPHKFYELVIEVDYNGAFLFYSNTRNHPIPIIPEELKDDEILHT